MNQPTQPQPTNVVPHLLRALYEWIGENNDLPQVLVDQTVPGVEVPPHLKANAPVLYSVDMVACPNVQLGNDAITGSMRFNGRAYNVRFPIESIIYIKGRQLAPIMMFRPMPLDASRAPTAETTEAAPAAVEAAPSPREAAPVEEKKRPFLSVVK